MISIPSATTVIRLDTLLVTVDPAAALALALVNATIEEAETRAPPTLLVTATATIVDVRRHAEEVLAVIAMIAVMIVIVIDAVEAETAAMTGEIAMIAARIDVSMREGTSNVMIADNTPVVVNVRTLRICTAAEAQLKPPEDAQDHLAQAQERVSAPPEMIRQIVKIRVQMITAKDKLPVKIVKMITSVPVAKKTLSAKIVHLPVVLILALRHVVQLPAKLTPQKIVIKKLELTLMHPVRVFKATFDQKLSCHRNKAVINCKKNTTKKMIRKLDESGA